MFAACAQFDVAVEINSPPGAARSAEAAAAAGGRGRLPVLHRHRRPRARSARLAALRLRAGRRLRRRPGERSSTPGRRTTCSPGPPTTRPPVTRMITVHRRRTACAPSSRASRPGTPSRPARTTTPTTLASARSWRATSTWSIRPPASTSIRTPGRAGQLGPRRRARATTTARAARNSSSPGRAQYQLAGMGIRHTERNASRYGTPALRPVLVLTVEDVPDYDLATPPVKLAAGRFSVLRSCDEESLPAAGAVHVFIATGAYDVGGHDLRPGDSVRATDEELTITGDGQLLLLELRYYSGHAPGRQRPVCPRHDESWCLSPRLPERSSPIRPSCCRPGSRWRFTLGFHIILVPFGVAFTFIMMVANYRGLRRGDADAMLLAQRWSKVAAVLFAVGAVSGTVLSFEMGLLWPGLMGRFGAAYGIPFAVEGIFFFLEAIFVAIYIYGWNRLPPVGALLDGAAGGAGRHRRHVLRRRGQQLDEHAGRDHHARTARSSTSTRGGCSSTARSGTRRSTCCWPLTWSPGSPSPASTRSGCCAAGATATTALGLLDRRSRSAAIAIPLQIVMGDFVARYVFHRRAGQVRRDRGAAAHRARTCPRPSAACSSTARSATASPIPDGASLLSGFSPIDPGRGPGRDPGRGAPARPAGHDRAPGVRRHGRHRASRSLALALWFALSWWRARAAAAEPVVPARRGGQRRGRRSSSLECGLGGHRGRPAAVDGRRPAAHPGRGAATSGNIWPLLRRRRCSSTPASRSAPWSRAAARCAGAGPRGRGDADVRTAPRASRRRRAVMTTVVARRAARRRRRVRACSAAPTSAPGSGTSPPAAPSAGRGPRALIDHAIGPVWEANHIWLIFCLVMLWTGFPDRVRGDHDHAVHPARLRRVRDRAARLRASPSARCSMRTAEQRVNGVGVRRPRR